MHHQPCMPNAALLRHGSDVQARQAIVAVLAAGEALECSKVEAQSLVCCLGQTMVLGPGCGALVGLLWASWPAGLAVAALSTAITALLVVMEAASRVVLTDASLVLQASAHVRRFQRADIEDCRLEALALRDWLRLDVGIVTPKHLLRRQKGLRFRHRGPDGWQEVFIGIEGADDLCRRLTRTR